MRLYALTALVLGVALLAIAGPSPRLAAESKKPDSFYTGGFWTPFKDGPFASMYGDDQRAWLGVMRSPSSKGFDFAILAEKGETPCFQIIDEKGDVHWLPVTALLKLKDVAADKPKSSDSPVAQPAEAKDIPRGYRVLYAIARVRAAGELAKRDNISRAAAKEKIDSVSDKQLHELVEAAGLKVSKAYPGEGRLKEIIDWLIEHQELILAIVTLLLSLFS